MPKVKVSIKKLNRKVRTNAGSAPPPTKVGDALVRLTKDPTVVKKEKHQSLTKTKAPSLESEYKVMDKNAMAYVGLLLDPFTGKFDGARVPDLLSWPTATCKFKDYAPVVIAAGNQVQIVCTPNFNSTTVYGFKSSRGAVIGAAYGALASDPASASYATANSTFASYRTVSFGVRLVSTTAVGNRAGLIRFGRVWDPSTLSTASSAIAAMPSFNTVPANSEEGSDVRITWRPGDYETGLDMQYASSQLLKGSILFEIVNDSPVQQSFYFEIYHAVEFMPIPVQATLFTTASVPGNEGAVSAAMGWIDGVIGNVAASASTAAMEYATNAISSWFSGGSKYGQTPRITGPSYGSGLMIEEMAVRNQRVHVARARARGAPPAHIEELSNMLQNFEAGVVGGSTLAGEDEDDDDFRSVTAKSSSQTPLKSGGVSRR